MRNTILILISIFTIGLSAKTFSLPGFQANGESDIVIKNNSDEKVQFDIFLRDPISFKTERYSFQLEAHSKIENPFSQKTLLEKSVLLQPSAIHQEDIEVILKGTKAHKLDAQLANYFQTKHNTIFFHNPSMKEAHIKTPEGNRLRIAPYSQLFLEKARIGIYQSSVSLNMYEKSQDQWLHTTRIERLPVLPKSPKSHYFLMGSENEDHHPNFIVKITDPRMLAKARLLLRNPTEQDQLLFGKINLNPSSFNYNLNSTFAPSWNWELVLEDFVGVCWNHLQINPQLIEDFLPDLIRNRDYVCLPNYKIKAELK
ncbi:MAG: hypothetical protein AB8E15_12095 [Bdellovibrionales bacterium]